ncbi:hypothetical protein R3P38DRAFT_2858863 [Favolaschia claudopus]|uniref:Uncharacterized protein n=1 Tax=Favolaschia claudopus TaxID=2862362 RepID=A0AAW0DK71_9AGAR
MFTVLPIALPLALARGAASTPVSRAACNPSLVGVGISIASGNLEAEFVGETATIVNGAPGLYLTWVNGTIKLETLVTPEDGKQDWGFVCSTCNAPSGVKEGGVTASACDVVNGNTVGDALTVANCVNVKCASQSFDVYTA